MVDRAQLLKGLLEGCILKTISNEETYGYKITEDLNNIGFNWVNEGTIYPILMRLEKKMFICSVKKSSNLGPKRKYFYITESGSLFLKSFTETWDETSTIVNTVLKGGKL
jgi:PadR family transcriptional regulator PadR